jgi:DNA-binding transcriptional MocR family regulator
VNGRAEKAVLLAIRTHLPNPRPSVRRLAELTGYSVRWVQRALQRLERSGEITRTQGTGRRSSCYDVTKRAGLQFELFSAGPSTPLSAGRGARAIEEKLVESVVHRGCGNSPRGRSLEFTPGVKSGVHPNSIEVNRRREGAAPPSTPAHPPTENCGKQEAARRPLARYGPADRAELAAYLRGVLSTESRPSERTRIAAELEELEAMWRRAG